VWLRSDNRLGGQNGEALENVGYEQVRLEVGAVRERGIRIALGKLSLSLRDPNPGACDQRLHRLIRPTPACRRRDGVVGPASGRR
jgi:hypothetical protein